MPWVTLVFLLAWHRAADGLFFYGNTSVSFCLHGTGAVRWQSDIVETEKVLSGAEVDSVGREGSTDQVRDAPGLDGLRLVNDLTAFEMHGYELIVDGKIGIDVISRGSDYEFQVKGTSAVVSFECKSCSTSRLNVGRSRTQVRISFGSLVKTVHLEEGERLYFLTADHLRVRPLIAGATFISDTDTLTTVEMSIRVHGQYCLTYWRRDSTSPYGQLTIGGQSVDLEAYGSDWQEIVVVDGAIGMHRAKLEIFSSPDFNTPDSVSFVLLHTGVCHNDTVLMSGRALGCEDIYEKTLYASLQHDCSKANIVCECEFESWCVFCTKIGCGCGLRSLFPNCVQSAASTEAPPTTWTPELAPEIATSTTHRPTTTTTRPVPTHQPTKTSAARPPTRAPPVKTSSQAPSAKSTSTTLVPTQQSTDDSTKAIFGDDEVEASINLFVKFIRHIMGDAVWISVLGGGTLVSLIFSVIEPKFEIREWVKKLFCCRLRANEDEECPSETEDGKFADDLVPVRYLTAQHLAAIQGMPQVAYTQNPLAIQQQPQSAFGTAQSDFGTLQRGSVQNVVVQQPQTPSVAGNSTMVNGYSASELGRVLLTAQTVPKVLPFVPSPVSMQSVAGAMSQPAATAQWVTDTLPPLPNIPMRAAKLAAKKNLNMSSTTKTRVKRQK